MIHMIMKFFYYTKSNQSFSSLNLLIDPLRCINCIKFKGFLRIEIRNILLFLFIKNVLVQIFIQTFNEQSKTFKESCNLNALN